QRREKGPRTLASESETRGVTAIRSANGACRMLMSALGHKRTFCDVSAMSALPPKADMCSAARDVQRSIYVRVRRVRPDRNQERGHAFLAARWTIALACERVSSAVVELAYALAVKALLLHFQDNAE